MTTLISPKLLYITCKDALEAQTIARELVESHLAACGNIIPNMQSIYFWEGSLQIDSEAILVIKTMSNRVNECIEKIKKTHSYKIPCILEIDIRAGHEEYLNWLAGQTLLP